MMNMMMKDNHLKSITFTALADTFQSLFKQEIMSDETRWSFWMGNRDRIEKPIYITAMVKAMQEVVKESDFQNLIDGMEFCDWIVTHSQSISIDDKSEKILDYMDWDNARRQVLDFIDACLSEDAGTPITMRDAIANILEKLCTQPDRRLDSNTPIFLDNDDKSIDAVNNIRSRALESLIKFGLWVRREIPDDDVAEVTSILSDRLADNASIPLMPPEYTMLGMLFRNLCYLNKDWVIKHLGKIFPQKNISIWRDVFGNYIRFNHPNTGVYRILENEFAFAVDNLDCFTAKRMPGTDVIFELGKHLLIYHIWGLYPLRGDTSPLAKFYEKVENQSKCSLFDFAGRDITESGKGMNEAKIKRSIEFFNWRLENGDPEELAEFSFWLEAKCLDPEWRLESYLKILDHVKKDRFGFYSEIKTLNTLSKNHLGLVMKCLLKITNFMEHREHFYIRIDDINSILEAGLNSEDSAIYQDAKSAQENLYRLGLIHHQD